MVGGKHASLDRVELRVWIDGVAVQFLPVDDVQLLRTESDNCYVRAHCNLLAITIP